MAVDNWIKVFIRAKYILSFCIVGFLVNFLLFSRYSCYFTPTRMVSAPSASNEHRPKLGPRELFSSIQKQKSSKDYNKYEILYNVRNILSVMGKSNARAFPIVKELFLQMHNTEDVTRLLADLENTNTSFSDFRVGNVTQLLNATGLLQVRCPDKPPGLLGKVASNLATVVPEFLEKNYAGLVGGHHSPKDCAAGEKLAIIIPYRNRHAHLHILLNNLLPILIRQQLDFRIFVVEQAMPTIFNRCLLFNIGYLEAMKMEDYDCFIFHDVDMVPLNDHCLYRCAQHPRHLTAAVSKWKYRLPYTTYFGGAVAFTRKQFRDINGCSNLYFGWGGEDDDMRSRVIKSGYTVIRYPKDIGRYDTIVHKLDEGNSPNIDREELLESSKAKLDSQGLNTTMYKVIDVAFKPLYTWINVKVNMTQILETTPKEMLKDVRHMVRLSKQQQ